MSGLPALFAPERVVAGPVESRGVPALAVRSDTITTIDRGRRCPAFGPRPPPRIESIEPTGGVLSDAVALGALSDPTE